MKTRLIILTRYFLPMENAMAQHTIYVSKLLEGCFDETLILCEKHVLRQVEAGDGGGRTVLEFASVRDLYAILSRLARSGGTNFIFFQYVPHMWGRGGMALYPSLVPLWMRWRFRVPVVTFLHELKYDLSMHPRILALGVAHRIQLFLISIGSRNLIVTNDVRYRAFKQRRHWTQRDKVSQVPAGCITGRSSGGAESDQTQPYITWFGTLSEDQRLEELVQAFSDVRRQCAALQLVIIGSMDGQSKRWRALQADVHELGLEDSVVFRGFVRDPDLSALLRGSLANFHMAASGPSGRRSVVAAFLRSGRPMVAIRGYETDPEFIHGFNVYLVQPERTSIGQAIIHIFSNEAARVQLEAGSRQLYEAAYSDQVIGRKLVNVLLHTS